MFRHEGVERTHRHSQLLEASEPQAPRTFLLLTILVTFIIGSALGAVMAVSAGQIALLAPPGCLAAGGLLALRDIREIDLPRSTGGTV
ncbi:MAG: hypothetical protein JWP01_2810 [Myxococcales bacterium]|nr:hypothetical protein [Myxococcales bacterium]